MLSGAQAFLALWAALPGWRWMALTGRLPGAAWAMERIYRLFLLYPQHFAPWSSDSFTFRTDSRSAPIFILAGVPLFTHDRRPAPARTRR